MPRSCRYALRLAATAWLIAIMLTLMSGCGGGDWDADDEKTTQPPDCKAHPEQCQ